jgi:hypothetical protein
MSSPFPGMDPFLEGEMWQEFHATLAGEIRAQLLPHLRPKYVALLEKRYVLDRPIFGISQPTRAPIIYPDVHVVHPASQAAPFSTRGGSVAVMEPTVELLNFPLDPIPVTSIEIRDIANRLLVTAIEILSPVNKRGEGAREYNERRDHLLESTAHILEIDLLVQGIRIALEGDLPLAPYYVYLSRANRRPKTQVWALPLQDPLPVIPVPLLAPDADVPLDLQAAVDACFALVGYEDLLDYRSPLPAGHSAEDAAWVQALLQASER